MARAPRLRTTLVHLASAAVAAAAFAGGATAQGNAAAVTELVTDAQTRIWSFPDDGGDRFVLMVLVGSGSRDEARDQAGIAHFLEHVLFTSTARGSKQELDLAGDAHGAAINGFTEQELTAYHIATRAADWEFAVDWLAQHVVEPAFLPADVEAERRIVSEELDYRNPHAGGVTFESLLYPDQPLGRAIGGTKRSLDGIDVDELRRFYSAHYRAANVAVGFSGRVPRETCIDAIRAAFARLPAGDAPLARAPTEPRSERMTLGARDDFDASANVVLGYHLAGGGARDLAVELVGSAYLRQRFFDEIREERQLAYAPQVELVQFSDTHRLEFSTHVSDQGNLPQIIGVCNALIDELRRPDPALVLAARDARAHALEVDSAEDLSRAMKLAWLTRRRGETPGALLDALTRVDAAALAEFASRNFEDDQRFVISDSALAGGAMSVWMIAALLVLFLVFTDAWRGFPLFRGAAQRWSAWKHRPRSARPRESRKRAPRDRIVPIDVDELERSIQRHFDDLDHK